MPTNLTAVQAAEAVRAGELSAAELFDAYRERAAADELNAYTWVADAAPADAPPADAPLAGVPIAIKDLFCTEGVPSQAGSRILEGYRPPYTASVVARLAAFGCRIAVDTSDAPLTALVQSFGRAAPDLIKPNAEELAGVLGLSPLALEAAVTQGDPEPVISAAQQLIDRGVGAVLATLGSAGAILVDDNGGWFATPPPITPRSTVGAGDAALAGYLRAQVGGATPPQRLQMAVAYGSAAAALPGSAQPHPADLDLDAVHVTPVVPATDPKVVP